MKSVVLYIIGVVISFVSSSERTINRDYYVAAVVEAVPGTSLEIWRTYADFVVEASKHDVDIIVFPEDYPSTQASQLIEVPLNGLLKTRPVPALYPDDYDARLVLMSQAARNHSMYVIVNVHEVMDCRKNIVEECPEAKLYIFNTNVVFDRNGAVIYRYRKNYLFIEEGVTPSLEPGIGVFTTDFGVTFGILTCFDILNSVPWEVLSKNITNIVANSNWVSEMPFLTSIQAHEAITYALNVNMVMSGANNVSDSSSGTGIYSGKSGAVISFIAGSPVSRLLVAKVPTVPGNALKNKGPIREDAKTLNGLKTVVDDSLFWHNSTLLVPGHQKFELVQNDLTCRFRIQMRERNVEQKYTYRAGAFSGLRSILGRQPKSGVRDCAVFSCTGKTVDTCGDRFNTYTEDATAIFKEIFIEGSFTTSQHSTFYPISLDVNLLPLEPNEFEYRVETSNDVTVHVLSLKNFGAKLYTFGLWGRQFDWDEK